MAQRRSRFVPEDLPAPLPEETGPLEAARVVEEVRATPVVEEISGEAGVSAWIRRSAAGDRQAFELLLKTYQSMVLRVARSLVGNPTDAEDVAQEAFVRFYRSLARLDAGRDPVGWIYRLTVNASWDLLERRRKDRRLAEDFGRESMSEGRFTRGTVEEADLPELLRRSLQVLPPRVRAVFVLREVEGLEVVDIARTLRITRITVRRHLSRARQKLHEHLAHSHPELIDRQ